MVEFCELCVIFLSTPSARRATHESLVRVVVLLISIHALCEEGDSTDYIIPRERVISIHALCEEGDCAWKRPSRATANFYPRPLRGGRLCVLPDCAQLIDISIHALCEEGDVPNWVKVKFFSISIHALCEEGDVAGANLLFDRLISIHALCEEGDRERRKDIPGQLDFYPRPLRGGRRERRASTITISYFYPRPLRGGRQAAIRELHAREPISIHALCEEGDVQDGG